MLELPPDKLVLNDRRIYFKKDPAIGVSYLDALHKSQEDVGALIASGDTELHLWVECKRQRQG